MKQLSNSFILFICLGMNVGSFAQTASIHGTVTGNTDHKTLTGITVSIKENSKGTLTDENGKYELDKLEAGEYTLLFSSVGFETVLKKITLGNGEIKKLNVTLKHNLLDLSEITVSSSSTRPGENKMDMIAMQLQPVKSAQDLLRTVPGLFIAQHAGGGKAEQIFVRGTDNDHGTDFAIFYDDLPVNMPTHGHGQGYSDMHFMIPETVGKANFFKGPYEAKLGDFSISGASQFYSKHRLENNLVKLEYGMFNSQRALLMVNVLDKNHLVKNWEDNAYIAADYMYTDGYFINKLHFKRYNIFGKYNARLSSKTNLTFTASSFSSDWDASGQLPWRAVENGELPRFGSVDPSEGGITSRTNISLKTVTQLNNNSSFKNQFYYTKNLFSLFSNFTFFMNDSLNGDGIHQWENRDLLGYNGSYNRTDSLGKTTLHSEAGFSTRTDLLYQGRDLVLKRALLTKAAEYTAQISNFSFYINESWQFHPEWNLNLGLRNDVFDFHFQDKMAPENSGNKIAYRFNPKLNLYYDISSNVTLYAKTGSGFHSNYIQAVVSKDAPANAIPQSYGADLGSDFKLGKRFVTSIALWWLRVGSEYKFVSDDGSFEEIGDCRKIGSDIAIKYQVHAFLWADININYAYSILLDAPADANLMPLCPNLTSTAGLTYKHPGGFSGSLRYRYMGERPATEDGSVISKSYFITDAFIKYTHRKYELGLSVENLFSTHWVEAQFYDQSRLKDENEPVYDFHNTPGTPFCLKGSISYFF